MASGLFTFKKALQVFGLSAEELASRGVISESTLPSFARGADNRLLKSWSQHDLPQLGELIGYLPRPGKPLVLAVFVTKGGVLKSSLTLNLARTAALHNIRTCVVGLDMQGDVTASLDPDALAEDASLEQAIAHMNSLRGLADVYTGEANLSDVVRPTDLPTLFYIPETPELVALDQCLIARNRREYWLRDQVVRPLQAHGAFDLILLDCSPNWNRLITNALVACDGLVSPLECKINNFRNFKTFRALMTEFKTDMGVAFEHAYVPTRLTPGRRLSQEIYQWYRTHLPECTRTAIRESTQGEEAVAMRLSLPEYAPSSVAADEMRELLRELWTLLATAPRGKEHSSEVTVSQSVATAQLI